MIFVSLRYGMAFSSRLFFCHLFSGKRFCVQKRLLESLFTHDSFPQISPDSMHTFF